MMEESKDILMSTLIESGVSIPRGFSSVGEFSSEALVSICVQLLNLIDPSSELSDEMLPDSLPERFRICTELALSVKNLGYISDMSYYKFLHPSEDDSCRLVRFLVERLSEKNEGLAGDNDIASRLKMGMGFGGVSEGMMVKEDKDESFDMHIQKVEAVLKDLTMTTEVSHSKNTSTSGSPASDHFSGKIDDPLTDEPSELSVRRSSGYEENSSEDPSETNCEDVELQNQHKLLLEELESGSSELCSLDSELELLKMASERLLDDKQSGGSYLEQLNQQLVVKRSNITDLKKQWNDIRLTLETKRLSLLDQLCVEEPKAKNKLDKLRKTELELQSLSSEIHKREDEGCNLNSKLERQPKAAPRTSYIHGIKEITKNSRKLDADILRISGETRELQLESNPIQERLHRSYAVVDDMVTREVKKDPAVRQVYKLLTSIHGIFEQISEKILSTDRLRRETVDYEKKLGSITARGMSLEKLQADLDAIRKENESLEK